MSKDSARGKYASPEGSRTWEYLSAVFCAMGMFCIGTMVGWNSPSLAELRDPNSRIPITPGDASTLTASLSVGYICGLFLSTFIVDRIGRRNSILVSIIPMMVNWGMILVAEHVAVIIVARITAGFSMGLMGCTITIYIVEAMSPHIRGSLGVIGSITCYVGILFMFGVAPHLGVRVTACFCMSFTAIFLICFWFIPESPYFLVMVGREDEADIILRKLRGKTDVTEELKLIKATFHDMGKSLNGTDDTEKGVTTEKQSPFRQLFATRQSRKSFLIGMTLMLLQHFSGFEIVLYYCHVILSDMGSGLDVYVASLIFSLLQVLSASLTVLTVDRFGRRPLLLISGVVTSFLLAVIATYFFLREHTNLDISQYSMIPLCSVFGLVMVLNMGVMSVPKFIVAEIFATDVKVLAHCIVGISGSMITMLTTKSYLLMATSWGFGHSVPFFGFTIVTFLCTVILMRWLPETKGKTLLEIQQELNA